MGSGPGMPTSSYLLTRRSEEHQAAEDIRPWLKAKTLRCWAEWFQSALSVLKQTAGRLEEDPKLPPCLGCWAGRGSSLRPAATFIWLKFQGLKSNIPVGKRMAQTMRSGWGVASPEDVWMGGEWRECRTGRGDKDGPGRPALGGLVAWLWLGEEVIVSLTARSTPST